MAAARHRHTEAPGRPHRTLRRVLLGVGVFVVVVAVLFFVAVRHLEGNIIGVGTPSYYKTGRPLPKVKGAINVLVMGDDTRQGQGPQIGGLTPGLSDTTVLLHLSANRKFAYGVSLPRDAMVNRPACKTGSGAVDQGGETQFNAAYAIGGPWCTTKTVESLTGVHIDHFVVVKFTGFRDMVDALGGVPICLPKPIDDNVGHIHMKAGTYNVTGEQALNYVRERHGVGDGSDIGRMKRQQAFMASMANKVVSAGTLANPVRLYNFLNAATKSLTVDNSFHDLWSLVSLGHSLKNIGLSNIKFVTVPFKPYPQDPNRLAWAPSAKGLWKLMIDDKPLTSQYATGAINASNTPGAKKKQKHAGATSSASASPSASSSSSPSASSTSSSDAQLYGLCS